MIVNEQLLLHDLVFVFVGINGKYLFYNTETLHYDIKDVLSLT